MGENDRQIYNRTVQGRFEMLCGVGISPFPAEWLTDPADPAGPRAVVVILSECGPECPDVHESTAYMATMDNLASLVASVLEQARESGYEPALTAQVERLRMGLRAKWPELGKR